MQGATKKVKVRFAGTTAATATASGGGGGGGGDVVVVGDDARYLGNQGARRKCRSHIWESSITTTSWIHDGWWQPAYERVATSRTK